MQSILRQIVAGPRSRHPEAGLDLCYVTDFLIATSGPSATYPSLAYRNPLDDLVSFLDKKHGKEWAIWEFRAEGTGYPDDAVYGRIWHWPWPDHHPPPFSLVPGIIGGMREWLHPAPGQSNDASKRVVVVHCKAGKGRSGTMACSYLMSEEAWSKEDALQRFTERRMKPGFGNGISIPSQLRWLDYVERWIAGRKRYVERAVEVIEVHVWGLREGVKMAVEGYIASGKKIKTFHVFTKQEQDDHESTVIVESNAGFVDVVTEAMRKSRMGRRNGHPRRTDRSTSRTTEVQDSSGASLKPPESHIDDGNLSVGPSRSGASTPASTASSTASAKPKANGETILSNVVFRPSARVILPTSDINLAVERRAHGRYRWSVVTSVAHVWFNCYFEGNGPENLAASQPAANPSDEKANAISNGGPDDSGVFSIQWEAMDGIKGSARKGTQAFDKVSVVWRAVPGGDPSGQGRNASIISESAKGEVVHGASPADWRGGTPNSEERMARDLGVQGEPAEADTAAAEETSGEDASEDSEDGAEGVRRGLRLPDSSADGDEADVHHVSTGNVPGDELRDRIEHAIGKVKKDKPTDITGS